MSALKSLERVDPTPFSYQGEVYARGLKYEKPSLTFDSTKWEGLAKERMSGDAWGYVYGSAGTRQTDENNIESLRKWALMSRRLRYQSMPDLSVELLGEKYPYPIAISPIGVQRIVQSDGEIATASAAAAERVPYICSTAASASIEDVAQANGSGHRWYQLYWPANEYNGLTASVLKRAQDAGYTVLVVTTDTYISGWRPSDMDNGYSPFLKGDQIGVAIGFTDPVYRTFFKDKYGKEVEDDMATAAATWSKIFFNGYPHNWEDLEFLRQHWKGPIAIKGIQSVEDAKKCVELGMDAVYVSTHGGRQCDAQSKSFQTSRRFPNSSQLAPLKRCQRSQQPWAERSKSFSTAAYEAEQMLSKPLRWGRTWYALEDLGCTALLLQAKMACGMFSKLFLVKST